MTDLIETTPQMDLAPQDIEHLVEELHAYHAYEKLAQPDVSPTRVGHQ